MSKCDRLSILPQNPFCRILSQIFNRVVNAKNNNEFELLKVS